MTLLVPRSAAEEIRREYTASLLDGVGEEAFLRTWNRDLAEVDDRLRMVKAKDETRHPALKPGFYAVIRLNDPPTPPSVLLVETDEGEFTEPDSSVFDMLKRSDLWSSRSLREQERRARELERARERREQHEHEERVAEVMTRFKSATGTSVSMASAGPWRASTGKR